MTVACHQEVLLLHVDVDNSDARWFYYRQGYRLLHEDAWWTRVFRKPQLLLFKNVQRVPAVE